MPYLISLMLFGAGLYLILARFHGLWLVIGLELMLNAAVPILIAAKSIEALTLTLVLLFFALLEAAAGLFLLYHYAREKGTLSLENLPPL